MVGLPFSTGTNNGDLSAPATATDELDVPKSMPQNVYDIDGFLLLVYCLLSEGSSIYAVECQPKNLLRRQTAEKQYSGFRRQD